MVDIFKNLNSKDFARKPNELEWVLGNNYRMIFRQNRQEYRIHYELQHVLHHYIIIVFFFPLSTTTFVWFLDSFSSELPNDEMGAKE